jgi:hypothetical protein
MDSEDLMGRVRALRAKGGSPKQIARALGVPPATVAPSSGPSPQPTKPTLRTASSSGAG